MSKLPMAAGTIRLINQIPIAVNPMPIVLAVKSFTIITITVPRCSGSIKEMEGITDITTNETLTAQKACHHEISTSNNRNSR